MNSDLVLKKQFEDVSSQIKSKQSSIPESVSPLMDVLLSFFQIMFERSSNQNRELRQSIEKQTQTIDNQTQTIQTLIQELEKTRQEKLKNDEIIKTLKTLLKSKTVDLDSLKRLLFQGGRGFFIYFIFYYVYKTSFYNITFHNITSFFYDLF